MWGGHPCPPSREAALCESPARQCRVRVKSNRIPTAPLSLKINP